MTIKESFALAGPLASLKPAPLNTGWVFRSKPADDTIKKNIDVVNSAIAKRAAKRDGSKKP